MNEQANSLSRPNKRSRASVPPEERKEYASKRRRPSEVGLSPIRRIRTSGVAQSTTMRPLSTLTRPVPVRKHKDGELPPTLPTAPPPLLPNRRPPAADESPFLPPPVAEVASRPSLRKQLVAGPPRSTCSRCESVDKRFLDEEQLMAHAPVPCLAFLHHDQIEKDRRGVARLNPQARARVINFLVHCQCQLPHPPSPCTLYVTISCFDRFCGLTLTRGDRDARDKLQRSLSAVAAACLHLCSKAEDVWPIDPSDLCTAGSELFTVQDIQLWQRRICQKLEFRISGPTAFDFVLQYLALIQRIEASLMCDTCGIAAEKPRILHLKQVMDEEWTPFQREGRARCAVEACIVFVLELVHTHPVCIQLTSHVLAAATIFAVLTILDHAVLAYLPVEVTEAGSRETANVLAVYREYLAAEAHHEREQLKRCGVIAAAVVPNAESAPAEHERYANVYDEEDNYALRRTRLTAYIINRGQGIGLNIPPHLARKTADLILGKKWKPVPLNELEPIEVDHEYPMGLFGVDVVTKHFDAANFLRPRFNRWAEEHELDCQTPSASATPVNKEDTTVRASLCTTASY